MPWFFRRPAPGTAARRSPWTDARSCRSAGSEDGIEDEGDGSPMRHHAGVQIRRLGWRVDHPRRAIRTALVLIAYLATAVTGCSGPTGPPTFEVSGAVTFAGKPVEQGGIVFDPVSGTGGPATAATLVSGVGHCTRGGSRVLADGAARACHHPGPLRHLETMRGVHDGHAEHGGDPRPRRMERRRGAARSAAAPAPPGMPAVRHTAPTAGRRAWRSVAPYGVMAGWFRRFAKGGGRCGGAAGRHHHRPPSTSPPARVAAARQTAGSIASATNRVAPSAMPTITPPRCRLRAARQP